MRNNLMWVSHRHTFTTANKILFFIALIIFITLTAFKSSYDSAMKYLTKVQGSVIGADLLLKSTAKIPLENFSLNNINISEKISYKTVIIKNDKIALVDLIAIDDKFPLVGDVLVNKDMKKSGADLSEDTVWLDDRAMAILDVSTGEKININGQEYSVVGKLEFIPQDASLTSISPKVVIKKSQVENSLTGMGLRVQYEWLLTGDNKELSQIEKFAKSRKDISLKKANDSSMVSNRAISRLDIVLIISLIFQIMISICLWIYSLRYYQLSNENIIRAYKAIGVADNKILQYYFLSGVVTIALAIIFGATIGCFVSKTLTGFILEGNTALQIPYADILIIGALLLILYCKSLARILREEFESNFSSLMTIFLIMGVLFYYLKFDSKLWEVGLAIFGGYILIYIFIYLLYKNIIKLLGHSLWHVRYAAIQIQRYAKDYTIFSSILILILSLCISFVYINKTITYDWKNKFNKNIPNYFFIDIPSDSKDKFIKNLKVDASLYPSVSAKLVKINEDTLLHPNSKEPGRKGFHRDLKISSFIEQKNDNNIISGSWLSKDSKEEVSVESGFAKRMNINLGDSLVMQIGEENIKAKVSSLRTVDWQDMTPNFFLIFSPDLFKGRPFTYMTSVYLDEKQEINIKNVIQDMPMISIFDSKMIISGILKLIDRMSAIMYAFSGVLVVMLAIAIALIIACQFKNHEKEWKLLIDIGIKFNNLKKYLAFEYSLIGVIIGLISISLGIISSGYILHNIFNLKISSEQIKVVTIFVVVATIISLFIGNIISRYITKESGSMQ